MNALFKTTLLALLLAMGWAGSATAQTRIATVDLRKLFDNFWKTKQADAALKERASELDKEHKGLLETYNNAMDEYKKRLSSANDQAVSSEERDKRKKSAEEKLIEIKSIEDSIRQFEAQAKEILDTQRRRMREQVLKEIKEVIATSARSDNFDLVLDTTADSMNSTPMVVFTTGSNDITDKVLAKLNADAPKDAPVSEEKKDEKKVEKKDEQKKPDAKR